MNFTLLYRGLLSSCNYQCAYCPFAKQGDDRETLAADEAALRRFVDFLSTNTQHRFSVFFTPWGEALIRRYYQQAIAQLCQHAHIDKVIIQTNLSWSLRWLDRVDTTALRLWISYHPSQVSQAAFVEKCQQLQEKGVQFSVGTVGEPSQLEQIQQLRDALPADIYVWINALDDAPNQYSAAQIQAFEAIDPLFRLNLPNYPSQGKYCRTGQSVFSVAANGTLHRCHFIPEVLGNLYTIDLSQPFAARTCTKPTCNCYIGYVHLPHLGLEQWYCEGLLERIYISENVQKSPTSYPI